MTDDDMNTRIRAGARRNTITFGEDPAHPTNPPRESLKEQLDDAMQELEEAKAAGDAPRASHLDRHVEYLLEGVRLRAERRDLDTPPPAPVSFDAGARQTPPGPGPSMNQIIRADRLGIPPDRL
jgi:hypothetical protein